MDLRDEIILKQLMMLTKYETLFEELSNAADEALVHAETWKDRAEKAEAELAIIRGWGN